MKLSGELDYRIRYDVEHDLFHAQNVFSDEYITPTFVEYVQKLEKENAELKGLVNQYKASKCGGISLVNRNMIMFDQLTKSKEIIRSLYFVIQGRIDYKGNIPLEDEMYRANQFLNSEVEK